MNYAEIIDKIKGIVTDSDEYLNVLINLENIVAVTKAGRSLFEEYSAEPEVENNICALFSTIESVVGLAKTNLTQLTNLVTDTAIGKITPENCMKEIEGGRMSMQLHLSDDILAVKDVTHEVRTIAGAIHRHMDDLYRLDIKPDSVDNDTHLMNFTADERLEIMSMANTMARLLLMLDGSLDQLHEVLQMIEEYDPDKTQSIIYDKLHYAF